MLNMNENSFATVSDEEFCEEYNYFEPSPEELVNLDKEMAELMEQMSDSTTDRLQNYDMGLLLNFNINLKDVDQKLKDLCDNDFGHIKNYFTSKKSRPEIYSKYERLFYIIMANLYKAYCKNEFLMYHRSYKFFNRGKKERLIIKPNRDLFSYTFTISIIEALLDNNLIFHKTGSFDHERGKGKISRAYPINSLAEKFKMLQQSHVKYAQPEIVYEQSDHLVMVRYPDSKEYITKKRIFENSLPLIIEKKKIVKVKKIVENMMEAEFCGSEELKSQYLRAIKDEVMELNNAISDAEITITLNDNYRHKDDPYHDLKFSKLMTMKKRMLYMGHRTFLLLDDAKLLKRIFCHNNLELGGRLYGLFQQYSSKNRQNIKINGEPCKLIDISQSHIRMLYHMVDNPCDQGDVYMLYFEDNSNELRKEIVRKINKKLTQTIINSSSFDSAVRSGLSSIKDVMKKYKREDIAKKFNKHKYSKEWLRKFEEKHNLIKGYFYTGAGVKLQYLESKVIIASMLELLREHNTVSLPVHDELIVPESKEELAIRIMKRNYQEIQEFNGHQLFLDVK